MASCLFFCMNLIPLINKAYDDDDDDDDDDISLLFITLGYPAINSLNILGKFNVKPRRNA